MPIMCKECGQRPSKIHYTEIVNNKMVSMDLCAECAERKGLDVEKAQGHGLGDLVAGLIDTAATTEAESIGKVSCPTCAYDYSQFRKLGRFGCPDCYDAFEQQLKPLLRQIHGSTRHEGKRPEEMGSGAVTRRELMDLKEQLAAAVSQEDYEAAAQLRDEIKELEAGEAASGNKESK